ncbi:hypothetical protein [Streptomyces sp. SID1328]|nr:hypothetical protein [Streptomyces sp. SID1328]
MAGTGAAGYDLDGVQATDTRLDHPASVAVDASGNFYIAEGVGR